MRRLIRVPHTPQIFRVFCVVSVRICLITLTLMCYVSSWKHTYIIYTVKLGFIGLYIIVSYFCSKTDCGYSLEPPRRGGSNEYPQTMSWAEIRKISEFLSENIQFLMVKLSVYLNRRVFVMYLCSPMIYCENKGMQRYTLLRGCSEFWSLETSF